MKTQLRRACIRVLSVTQDLTEDPMGTLMEGFFECIDQYESELNGLRTAAAMREAIKQGFYPGGLTPYGYCKVPIEVRVGKKPRYKLAIEPAEAEILRTMYRLYITGSGAMKVAEALTARGFRTRSGHIWDKGAVIQTSSSRRRVAGACTIAASCSHRKVTAWRNFILRDHDVGRTYALHLIDHVDVHGERIVITPKEPGGRKERTMLAALQ